jgi:D-xylulose reductase
MSNDDDNDEEDLPHPLDLPPLSSRPSYTTLVTLLKKLTPPPPSWATDQIVPKSNHNYTPWLTRLIATPLPWLTESDSESIVSMASNNLALRAGRVALPDMTRNFQVDSHILSLFEPSWTGDSLGHKTWGASLLLAKRLSSLHIVSTSPYLSAHSGVKCLGLGEGTGLLGIAAAKVMSWTLTLTDLPDIIGNLRRNVEYNCGDRVKVRELDWMNPPDEGELATGSFEVVIASDLFYDTHHPKLVVEMMERYLKRDPNARVIIEYPLRTSHAAEVTDFEERIGEHFLVESTGEEFGRDDWDTEIHCRWAIYKWNL